MRHGTRGTRRIEAGGGTDPESRDADPPPHLKTSIRVTNLSGFVDRPTPAASSPDLWLLRFALPDLVRMNLTRYAINNSAIRLDFPDRLLNDKKTGN